MCNAYFDGFILEPKTVEGWYRFLGALVQLVVYEPVT